MQFIKKYLYHILAAIALTGVGFGGYYWWTHRALPTATAPGAGTPPAPVKPTSLTYSRERLLGKTFSHVPLPNAPTVPGTSGPQLGSTGGLGSLLLG